MTITDLTGTKWRFGEYIVTDYETAFEYNIETTYNIVCNNPRTYTLDTFWNYVDGGNYRCFASSTYSSIYYGYRSVPQIYTTLRDGFEYTEVTFGEGADATNATLIAWLEANATLVEEEPTATVITYNGSTIATLEAGQTATIKTAETEVEHDIIITPVFPINIAYGDIIATAEAGQTATIKCANTEADFDIVVSAKAEEESGNYLTFSSPSSFTLRTANYGKNWNGTLEYSTDASAWNSWSGSIITADGGKLYLRGTGNTIISDENKNWVLSGSNISCEGNIENLLDYATVANGEHPTMETYCFAYLFKNCGALISAPALPATTLTFGCYMQMFYGCTKLVNAPALPATTLANMCYQHMFCDCTSLTSIPAISALLLIRTSCYGMLEGCSSVKFSITQTEEYKYEYRIPSSGEGTKDGQPFTRMFASTGGTFTDDPMINTTYYTSNTVVY